MRGGELRRAEGGEDVLGGAFVLRQEVCGLLLRDDDHGDHATEEHEHAGDGEARNQVFDEQCAEHGADRSADGGAGAVEGGHGATDLGRHAVGQDGDHRRDHAVQTEHAGAVEDGQQHGVMRGAGQEQGDATEHGSEEDPRGTAAEAGTGAIGEVAEHQVGDQGCDRGERVDDADQRIGVDARDCSAWAAALRKRCPDRTSTALRIPGSLRRNVRRSSWTAACRFPGTATDPFPPRRCWRCKRQGAPPCWRLLHS